MALKKTPVTGMKDVLPSEMQIREYVMNQIKDTYQKFGFLQIETPCVEHIENLTSKQGGDNEKLIFKILKRGESLNLPAAKEEAEVVNSGLRYDLTLPLARYYAANGAKLPAPFKALQMGSVWRADKPQKGRYRQFVQCDIDVLGDATPLAEIELILATTAALGKIAPGRAYTVRINDRGMLRGMAGYCNFKEADYDQVFIILDKMDKIGRGGVEKELVEAGYEARDVRQYLDMFEHFTPDAQGVRNLGKKLSEGGVMEPSVYENLAYIMDTVLAVSETSFSLAFDPTLVRGMSYYTGTIFEVAMEGFSGSVAGGGRYDKMIGRFTGKETPACGFSIGFERIVGILLDAGFVVPGQADKQAYLFEKGIDKETLGRVMQDAQAERKQGKTVLVAQMNKNKKFQKQQLEQEGYREFKEYYKEALKY